MASDPDTIIIGVELQEAGENLNTWGKPKLNTTLSVLARAAHGFQELSLADSTTITGTNYVATNFDEVATLKLSGSPSAAFNVVFPGREKRLLVKNNTAQTATLKLSASAGFALPANRTAIAIIDGSDVENWTPNHIAAITGEATQDLTDVAYVSNAIANVSSGFATNGTLFASAADISADYLTNKLEAGSNISLVLASAGSNETIRISSADVNPLGLAVGGQQSSTFTAASDTAYRVNCESTAVTAFASSQPSAGEQIMFQKHGNGKQFNFNPSGRNVLGVAENGTLSASYEGPRLMVYTSTARGWV